MSTTLRINPTRLQSDFNALVRHRCHRGWRREPPALSPAHLEARAWFAAQVQPAGLALQIDGAGNHSAILPVPIPQPNPAAWLAPGLGARWRTLRRCVGSNRCPGSAAHRAGGRLRLPVHLEAIDFTDEEGTLVGFIGSGALAGTLMPGDLHNPRGGRQSVLDGLARAGLNEAGLFTARRPATLTGYLELHIEQGSRLYESGVDIGVVNGIVGIASFRLVFTGRAPCWYYTHGSPARRRTRCGCLYPGRPAVGDGKFSRLCGQRGRTALGTRCVQHHPGPGRAGAGMPGRRSCRTRLAANQPVERASEKRTIWSGAGGERIGPTRTCPDEPVGAASHPRSGSRPGAVNPNDALRRGSRCPKPGAFMPHGHGVHPVCGWHQPFPIRDLKMGRLHQWSQCLAGSRYAPGRNLKDPG